MKLKKLKPITNGTRHQVNLQKSLLSKRNDFVKNSIKGLKSSGGRSSQTGRTTVWHKGGGNKSKFREINFSSEYYNAVVVTVMYDSKRSAFISLNFDLDRKTFFRTITTNFVFTGARVVCDSNPIDLFLGSRTILDNIPTGSIVHSLSTKSNTNTIYARSAGSFCQLIQKGSNVCKLRLPSGKIIEVSSGAFATIGSVANFQHNQVILGKAGRNRHKGVRPTVRGVAMNPVDHPHGGRTNGGRPSVTPWGIPTKGKPTVRKNKKNYV